MTYSEAASGQYALHLVHHCERLGYSEIHGKEQEVLRKDSEWDPDFPLTQ